MESAMRDELFNEKAPELLKDLADHCTAVLIETLAIDAETAKRVGNEISLRIAANWGGQMIYLPSAKALHLSVRDQEIYNKFNGKNHSELAREFGVSLQWIYKLVKIGRQLDIQRRQKDFFS